MGLPVVAGATLACPMGLGTGVLNVTSPILLGGAPAATTGDAAPIVNVGPCGLCTSLTFPATAAATAAAMGVLTPMPCVPAPVGMWLSSPGPLLGGRPGLMNDGTLICAHGGAIRILYPGQNKVLY